MEWKIPPHSGVYITVRGTKYTLLNEEMLKAVTTLIDKYQDE